LDRQREEDEYRNRLGKIVKRREDEMNDREDGREDDRRGQIEDRERIFSFKAPIRLLPLIL
jgi:hypothetical protein